MNMIKRTIVILLAALVVVGAVVGLNQAGALAGMSGRGGPPQGQQLEAGAAAAGDAGDATSARPPFARHGGEHGEGASLGGLVEVGKNLAVIAVIVALVGLAGKVLQRGAGVGGGRPHRP